MAKNETKALTKVTQEPVAPDVIVRPAVTPVEAKKAWKEYQALKEAVLDKKEDIQKIAGRDFLKKSYWRKLATFFNLSVEVTDERVEDDEREDVTFHFICKATAPNGRFAIGSGSCNQLEKGRRNTLHNTRSTAETRAWNRAVSNLVGGGEVSAEEANGLEESNNDNHAYDLNTGRYVPAATVEQRESLFRLTEAKNMKEALEKVNAFIDTQGGKPTNWETLTKQQAAWLIFHFRKMKPTAPASESPENVEPEEIPASVGEPVKKDPYARSVRAITSKTIFAIAAELGISSKEIHQTVKDIYQLESYNDLTENQAQEFIKTLNEDLKRQKTSPAEKWQEGREEFKKVGV